MSLVDFEASRSADIIAVQLQEAVAHHRAGRLENAVAGYQAILQRNPGNPDASHNLGLLLLERGEVDIALLHLKTALEAQPENPRCWISYAEGLLVSGKADDARQVILIGRQSGLDGGDVDLLEARITVAWARQPDCASLRTLLEAGRFEDLLVQTQDQMRRFGDTPDLILLLADALLGLKRGAEVFPWLDKVCSVGASTHAVCLLRGKALNQLGDFEAAYGAYLKARALQPQDARTMALIGQNLYQASFFQEAYLWLRRAVLIGVDDWSSWSLLTDILKYMGGGNTELFAAFKALKKPPLGSEAECLLRVLEEGAEQDPVYRSDYRSAKASPPEDRSYFKRLFGKREIDQAVSYAKQMCESYPLDAFSWKAFGGVLKVQGNDLELALLAMQLGVFAAPDDAEGYVNLALLYSDMNMQADAESAARNALRYRPGYGKAYTALAGALYEQGKSVEALETYRQALSLTAKARSAQLALLHNNIGHLEASLGNGDLALEHYRQALRLDGDQSSVFSNLLFALSHRIDQTPRELFLEHRRYGEKYEAPLRRFWPRHQNKRDPERCLNIGFVSGDLYSHAVANFIEPVLAHMTACDDFRLHAYYNHSVEDNVTQRLKSHFDHWMAVYKFSDQELARKIEEDGIDILIDLSGHTAKNRLRVFARKPAPIQASWIGYPGTTGLRAMDYYLADRHLLPPGQFQSQFTENLVYLPSCAAFKPFEKSPPVNSLPLLNNGHVTFGSFNRLEKLNRATIALWSKLLCAVPGAQMLLAGTPPGWDVEHIAECFSYEGVARERLEFYPRTDMKSYLALHHKVDICLDTFPYAGGTTTYHALWMGVPTLTISGNTPTGRQGASILTHVGLEGFVASDAEDFVQKGGAWADNRSGLEILRAELRGRSELSHNRHPNVMAASLERALRIMWKRWCAGLPLQTFEV